MDFLLTEAPDRPTVGGGSNSEGIVGNHVSRLLVPIIPVGLDDQLGRFEHEVGLEASKHRLVHLEPKPTLLELIMEKTFDGGHLLRKESPQPSLPTFCPLLIRSWMAPMRMRLPETTLAYLLSCFGRVLPPKHRLPNLLPRFRGMFTPKGISFTKHRLACPLALFRGMLAATLSPAYLLSRPSTALMTKGVFLTQFGLAVSFSVLWRSFVNSLWHFTSNYSIVVNRRQ